MSLFSRSAPNRTPRYELAPAPVESEVKRSDRAFLFDAGIVWPDQGAVFVVADPHARADCKTRALRPHNFVTRAGSTVDIRTATGTVVGVAAAVVALEAGSFLGAGGFGDLLLMVAGFAAAFTGFPRWLHRKYPRAATRPVPPLLSLTLRRAALWSPRWDPTTRERMAAALNEAVWAAAAPETEGELTVRTQRTVEALIAAASPGGGDPDELPAVADARAWIAWRSAATEELSNEAVQQAQSQRRGTTMTDTGAPPVNLTEQVFDANMRAERIVHLGPMSVEMDDDLYDWLTDDAAPAMAEALGVSIEDFLATEGSAGRRELMEELSSMIAWKAADKWIVEASTPILTPSGAGYSFSWANYISGQFLGDTYPEAMDKALAWANSKPAVRTP